MLFINRAIFSIVDSRFLCAFFAAISKGTGWRFVVNTAVTPSLYAFSQPSATLPTTAITGLPFALRAIPITALPDRWYRTSSTGQTVISSRELADWSRVISKAERKPKPTNSCWNTVRRNNVVYGAVAFCNSPIDIDPFGLFDIRLRREKGSVSYRICVANISNDVPWYHRLTLSQTAR